MKNKFYVTIVCPVCKGKGYYRPENPNPRLKKETIVCHTCHGIKVINKPRILLYPNQKRKLRKKVDKFYLVRQRDNEREIKRRWNKADPVRKRKSQAAAKARYRTSEHGKAVQAAYMKKYFAEKREKWNAYMRKYNKKKKAIVITP